VLLKPGQHAADIGDNHVSSLTQRHLGRHGLNELDPIGAPIRRCDLSRHLDGIVRPMGVDAARPKAAGQ